MPSIPMALAWRALLPGIALWALALYWPLSLSLAPWEEGLASGPLNGASQQIVLLLGSLSLSLVAGLAIELGLGWALGPSWASSLGLVTALWALFWVLTGRS
jgi:hypothetical protein